MDQESDPYAQVHGKLAGLSPEIRDLFRSPAQPEKIIASMEQILSVSQIAGGKLHKDVESLADLIRLYLRHPKDSHLMDRVLNTILQIRQDATEI